MKKYCILFFALCMASLLYAQSADNRVVISELFYDTPLNEQIGQGIPYSNGEYIELYNLGDAAVNLTGWKLTGGGVTEKYDFPANTVIAPGSCILIVYQYYNSGFLLQDLFQDIGSMFPNATVLYQRKIILSNAGETVSLIDPTGKVVDYITYDGTSNKSKPDRLSAPNADGLTGWNCDALVRKEVMYDSFGCVIFDPTHWGLGLSPLEAPINISFDQPTQSENYIQETTYTSPDTGNKVVTYYDKLGRPNQTVNVGTSPIQQRSIVSFVEYDNMGRSDAVSYLSYAAPSQSAAIRLNPLSEQQDFYKTRYKYDHRGTDGNYAFAEKEYDNSGLGLTVKQGAPGRTYQLNAHPTAYEYGFNETWGPVRKYAIADNGDLIYQGTYADQQLTAKAVLQPTIGNEKSTSIEYREPNGTLVALEQRISPQDRRITYYVYDDLGRQRYILPASVNITASTTPLSQLTDNCFYTEYDEYGRVFKQYVPGASYTISIYDSWHRLAMSQDGEQRKTNKWSYTKYDLLNRPVMSGICSGGSYEYHKRAIQEEGSPYVLRNNSTHGYTDGCYPESVNDADVLSVTYYDDYNWVPQHYTFRSDLALDNAADYNIKGLVTGKKIKVLKEGTPQWLTTTMYYDDKYQVIQTIGGLYPQGREYVSNAYDYTGNVIEARVIQGTPLDEFEYRKWFNYDQQGRLLSIDQQVAGDSQNGRVAVVRYTYDELGRATEKKLHNGYETCSYNYDIAGTITRSNSSLFSYGVESAFPNDHTPPRYDGKPIHFEWWRPGNDGQGYKYSYERSGQISAAQYVEYWPEDQEWVQLPNFSEQDFLYDKNGNIIQLLRTDSDGEPMNDLYYTYTGNQLTGIIDYASVDSYGAYSYDLCGNLTYDPVEQLNFEYNELNLPSRIFGDNGEVRYIYDAEGQKLAAVTDGSFTYYRGVMIYTGKDADAEDQISILHPEGVIIYNNSGYSYKYHLTDYMGNVRTVALADKVSAKLVEEQRTDYYPFGLAHSYNNLHKNRYLFSGKELQDQTIGRSGFLGLYDFGARYYNPMLGRWFNTDPALQTTNPYLFCGNAPTFYIDKDGRWFGIDDLIAAAIGGIFNSVAGLITGDINSVGHFFASFGAGAVAGWSTLYVGPTASGALLGMANSTLSQGFNNGWNNINGNAVLFSGFMGATTAGLSSKFSRAISPALNQVTNGISSPVIQQAVNQGVTGAATGFTLGTTMALIQGASFEEAMQAGGTNALFGLTMGTINGSISGYRYAIDNGLNPLTGVEKILESKSYFNGTQYTDKVIKQMNDGDDPFHSFPKKIDDYAKKHGKVTVRTGSDGKTYHWLEIPGKVNGTPGTFEYIKNPVTNEINHRYFKETITP